jgi:hypothetical protein
MNKFSIFLLPSITERNCEVASPLFFSEASFLFGKAPSISSIAIEQAR